MLYVVANNTEGLESEVEGEKAVTRRKFNQLGTILELVNLNLRISKNDDGFLPKDHSSQEAQHSTTSWSPPQHIPLT